jgi:hypothetical protein
MWIRDLVGGGDGKIGGHWWGGEGAAARSAGGEAAGR